MYPVIKRGTSCPTKKMASFTTAFDDQTTVLIQVYEGGRPYTNLSYFLGEFELTGIPLAKKGVPRIDVTFEVGHDGALRVSSTSVMVAFMQADE
jgi:molecular chaperone DnaK (HSP70)